MDINSALKKLYSLHQFGIKLGLDSTFKLLQQVGSPHEKLKCFHIAGSNGKGSTASFIASILIEMGFKVGLYTSPHFVRFNERIRINGKEIDDDYIANFVIGMEKYIDENEPTFFELTTAMAFQYFAENNIDLAVIETGLGGRLDSTNVINPLASIITSISLEHTNILGNTIEKIAYEKAGIIKKNVPVFTGELNQVAARVIGDKAEELNCGYFPFNSFAVKKEDHVCLNTRVGEIKIYKTALPGFHQLMNASLAVKTVTEILDVRQPIFITRGINNVIVNSKIQGRYEVVSSQPRIIFDSAHNPEGIESFIKEFRKDGKNFRNRCLIFCAMKDKDYQKMLELISEDFTKIYFTSIYFDRALTYEEFSESARRLGITFEKISDPVEFIAQFRRGNANDCLAILGSMYLLGEIKSKILEKGLDIEAGTI